MKKKKDWAAMRCRRAVDSRAVGARCQTDDVREAMQRVGMMTESRFWLAPDAMLADQGAVSTRGGWLERLWVGWARGWLM